MASRIEFTVSVGDANYSLSQLFRTLEQRKVKFEAISETSDGDCTALRFVASRTGTATAALRRSDLEFSSKKVLVLKTAGDPGALDFIRAVLISRSVDVGYMYSGRAADGSSTLVVGVSDVPKAERVVSGMGQYSD